MLRINRSEVPEFLRDSELYQNVTVEKQYYFDEFDIRTYDDFTQALQVLNHWKVENLPFEVFDFIRNNKEYLGKYKFEMVNDQRKKQKDPNYKGRYLRFFDTLTNLSQTSRDELCIIYNWRVSNHYFYPRNVHFMSECARLGCLNLMKYGRLHQMSWDFSVLDVAVKEDNFECFKYAIDNGCAIYELNLDLICMHYQNRLKYLQYASSKNKLYCGNDYAKLFNYAFSKKNVKCMEWAMSQSSDEELNDFKNKSYYIAHSIKNNEVLTFLVNNGFAIPNHACQNAFETSNYYTLKLLYQNGGKWNLVDDGTDVANKLKCLEFAYDMLSQ